jgi:hypothetical protein
MNFSVTADQTRYGLLPMTNGLSWGFAAFDH